MYGCSLLRCAATPRSRLRVAMLLAALIQCVSGSASSTPMPGTNTSEEEVLPVWAIALISVCGYCLLYYLALCLFVARKMGLLTLEGRKSRFRKEEVKVRKRAQSSIGDMARPAAVPAGLASGAPARKAPITAVDLDSPTVARSYKTLPSLSLAMAFADESDSAPIPLNFSDRAVQRQSMAASVNTTKNAAVDDLDFSDLEAQGTDTVASVAPSVPSVPEDPGERAARIAAMAVEPSIKNAGSKIYGMTTMKRKSRTLANAGPPLDASANVKVDKWGIVAVETHYDEIIPAAIVVDDIVPADIESSPPGTLQRAGSMRRGRSRRSKKSFHKTALSPLTSPRGGGSGGGGGHHQQGATRLSRAASHTRKKGQRRSSYEEENI